MATAQEHIAIIGNGIAGTTAARHIRKFSDKKITIISSESDYFFSRTALMYVFMGHMRWENIKPYEDWFWEKNRINLLKAFVKKIETTSKKLILDTEEEIKYDKLILATGSVARTAGWEGEQLYGVQTLISKQDLELLEKNSQNCKHAVLVGGGLIAVELAEMLSTRNIEVTILMLEEAFWRNALPEPDAAFISHHLESHGVTLLPKTQMDKILGDSHNKVRAVKLKTGEEIPCDLVGLCIGVTPKISLLKNSEIETDRGILVNRQLETNIPGIFAIGDCVQQREQIADRPSIEAVWYTARMMGETVAQNICGNPMEYKPGIWFNSAKFFDIEYQTYGRVAAFPEEPERHLFWEHQDKTKAINIAFHNKTQQFLGINTYGIRLRQAFFDQWIREKKSVAYVLENLKKANFDPEFYKEYHKEIIASLEY